MTKEERLANVRVLVNTEHQGNYSDYDLREIVKFVMCEYPNTSFDKLKDEIVWQITKCECCGEFTLEDNLTVNGEINGNTLNSTNFDVNAGSINLRSNAALIITSSNYIQIDDILVLKPRTTTPARAHQPPTACTTPEPAKSI